MKIDELVPGKSLCDMHDGLSVLESRIPGFKLVSHAWIRTTKALEIVESLLDFVFPSIYPQNKILYYYDQEISGLHKAVHHLDAEWFGIVTFEIDE